MGKGRVPGPYARATLHMRPPEMFDVDLNFVDGSDHRMIFRWERTDPPRVSVGTPNDINVTVGEDDGADTYQLVLPDEWAVTSGVAELVAEHTPMSLRPARDVPTQAKTYTIIRPVLSLDMRTGFITGTAVIRLPSDIPERVKGPLEIPVQIKVGVPDS